MNDYIKKRAVLLASYIIENNETVRGAARKFGISKSTIHKDITHRLKKIDRDIYNNVRLVLDKNKSERHLRGGQATKLKYCGKKCDL